MNRPVDMSSWSAPTTPVEPRSSGPIKFAPPPRPVVQMDPQPESDDTSLQSVAEKDAVTVGTTHHAVDGSESQTTPEIAVETVRAATAAGAELSRPETVRTTETRAAKPVRTATPPPVMRKIYSGAW